MNFDELYKVASERRTAKQYNHEQNVGKEDLIKLYEFVKTAPHSLGQEYVRCINISRDSEHKAKVTEHMKDFNMEKSFMASDIAIIVSKTQDFFYKENPEIIKACEAMVRKSVEAQGIEFKPEMAINLIDSVVNTDHANNGGNTEEWSARQAYIFLGYFMIGAAALNINSTPVEGFTTGLTDYLREQELIGSDERATLVVYLGYSENMERVFVGKGQLRKPLEDFVDFK